MVYAGCGLDEEKKVDLFMAGIWRLARSLWPGRCQMEDCCLKGYTNSIMLWANHKISTALKQILRRMVKDSTIPVQIQSKPRLFSGVNKQLLDNDEKATVMRKDAPYKKFSAAWSWLKGLHYYCRPLVQKKSKWK